MNLLSTILMLAISGLIVGGLARLVLPGKEALGMFGTILAGLAGSFVGGLIVTYLLGSTSRLLMLVVAVASAVVFIIPFRVFIAQPVVVPRRGFLGGRGVDPVYDDPYARRPFWSRRRGIL